MVLVLVTVIALYPRITEEIAYIRGMQAYVYGFPLVIMDVTKDVQTAVPNAQEYAVPMNQFQHMRTFVNPDFKNVVRISQTSIWSTAFLDLAEHFVDSQKIRSYVDPDYKVVVRISRNSL
jgi:hypothetical protein